MTKTAGLLLVIVGIVVIVWGGMGFKTREKVLDIGPIEATKEETHHLPYAPIAGGVAFVGGIALLLSGKRAMG